MSAPGKKIVVFATALRKSGGLTIYTQFLSHLPEHMGGNEYVIFKNPVAPQYEISGVRFVNVNTTTVFKRLYFDFWKCRSILKLMRFKPDVILSLQNFGVFGFRHIPQYVYYHNSIALFPQKWCFLKKKERALFMQKYIYPILARKSFYPSTIFFVQTEYMKLQFTKYFKTADDRVFVCFPDIDVIEKDELPVCSFPEQEKHFIYPATALIYKNHRSILYALIALREIDANLLKRIRVHFTISDDSFPELRSLILSNGLRENILFEGIMEHNKVLSMINASAGLLFPSEIETFGLPLVEAASFGVPVIVSDLGYSRSVLGGYSGARFVPTYDYMEWARQICDICDTSLRYEKYSVSNISSWEEMLRMVQSEFKNIEE